MSIKNEELLAMIEALEIRIVELESKPQRKGRDYGPASENSMTAEMAWRIRFGDLVGVPVRIIAADNGFSKGQVYSVTGNYTFEKLQRDDFDFNEDGVVTAK
jgi:hypothetical protein